MLFVATENRHLKSSKGWLFDDDECRFFASLSRLDATLDTQTEDYSLLIDEGYPSGEVGALLLKREDDTRLQNVILLAGHTDSKLPTSRNGRISIVRKDAMMQHLPAIARGKVEKADVMDITKEITGTSAVVMDLRRKIAVIGRCGCNVVIYGKTGSGKERVAQSIHSAFCQRAAQVVNCALLEGSLFDSFMFGHSKNAFSGAMEDKAGFVEEADGSSLILDEIETLSPVSQAKLLRFIETGEFRRVGETRLRYSRCRVIAMTNEPVEDLIASGRLRKDFYMRIAEARIDVKPLCERKEDIEALIRAREEFRGYREHIRDVQAFLEYGWPGNIRELNRTVDRLHRSGRTDDDLSLEDLVDDSFLSDFF